MSDKRTIILDSSISKALAHRYIDEAPEGYVAIIQEITRTIQQNAVQWPILQCFSEQLMWPVDNLLTKLTNEEWKDLLTAAFRKEKIRLAQGLEGGHVMLGLRTSQFGKKEFGLWLEFLNYVAAERGVKIIDKRYDEKEYRKLERVA